MAGQAFVTCYIFSWFCTVMVIAVSHIIHIAHVSIHLHLLGIMHLTIRHSYCCHAFYREAYQHNE
ncbi:MAG: hypothetical protein CVU29_01590 [Betaproteobacteria bacterium HGW-Betaproteobacteria-22]|nr:MAG: hypothetical protein CVU29_01590 [Betaproteobacteria bacterium HGW-Betaproteobacteria-22]